MDANYEKTINESINQLFEHIAKRLSVTDMARIREAYDLAAEAHDGQRRKSGEPYIIHPIAVARIVAEELELGANPIIAAFLHDVVEDTHYTIDDIRTRFGEDVAFLVGVVTKKKNSAAKHSMQVDNFRQILASVQYDIRALLIKLSDRLHNMRTLDSMRPDKQMKIAGETDYFYAPLANRLGLYHVKTELENLSFRYRCPREYATIDAQLAEERMSLESSISDFTGKINFLLGHANIEADTDVRWRSPYSAWRKIRTSGCDLQHVDGKHYTRIVYAADDVGQEKNITLHIYSILTDHFKERPGSVINYIDAPKANGYQSFHVKLLNEHGDWEEIHISSERMVRNSRLGCAAERTEENVLAWLKKFKAILKDAANPDNEIDYMDGVTSTFYNDDIMVFTPKGNGIILPKGATAIDFAYEIHSDMGLHALFARINGKVMSMKTVLHRGDRVEIGIDENSMPDDDWLAHVSTYKAKRNLRAWMANRPRLDYRRCERCHPLPGDEVIGFKGDDGLLTLYKRNCQEAVKLASQCGDSIVSVNVEENESMLYPVRIRIRAVDRYHLLIDLVSCVTERQRLSISQLHTVTTDRIVECTIDFPVHSIDELQTAINSIRDIQGVDEVGRVDLEDGQQV